MTSLISLVVILMLGVGGTAVADNAKPGDSLFGVDQAVEKIQLSLTRAEKKDDVRIKIAEERVDEVEELIAESESSNDDSTVSFENVTEIEADVFTNETVVKVEANDQKTIFITSVKTREEVVEAISEKFGIDKEKVESLLVLEVEDRESRPEDKEGDEVSDDSDNDDLSKKDKKEDIEKGLNLAVSVLSDVSGDLKNENAREKIQAVIDRLNERIGDFSGEIEIEVEEEDESDDDSGNKSKIKVKSDDGKTKIEFEYESEDESDDDSDDDKDEDKSGKSGQEISSVKTTENKMSDDDSDNDNDDSNGNDSNDDDSDDSDNSDDDSDQGGLEIEADVFTNITVVKVEINDEKTIFTTESTTAVEITADVLERFDNLNAVQVAGALEIEIEDRESKPEDLD